MSKSSQKIENANQEVKAAEEVNKVVEARIQNELELARKGKQHTAELKARLEAEDQKEKDVNLNPNAFKKSVKDPEGKIYHAGAPGQSPALNAFNGEAVKPLLKRSSSDLFMQKALSEDKELKLLKAQLAAVKRKESGFLPVRLAQRAWDKLLGKPQETSFKLEAAIVKKEAEIRDAAKKEFAKTELENLTAEQKAVIENSKKDYEDRKKSQLISKILKGIAIALLSLTVLALVVIGGSFLIGHLVNKGSISPTNPIAKFADKVKSMVTTVTPTFRKSVTVSQTQTVSAGVAK